MPNFCITTLVNEKYKPYAPLFEYCIKKAYPEYDVIVKERKEDGYTVAALRFVLGEEYLKEYEHVLITDVDILTMPEIPTLLEQHLTSMKENKLECYDNYLTQHGCPGVHFITKEWWDRTRDARLKYEKYLLEKGAKHKEDEALLYRIIKESNLPLPSKKQYFWTHGTHLLIYRNKKAPVNLRANESLFLQRILQDEHFLELVDEASKKDEQVKTMFGLMKTFFRRVYGWEKLKNI